MPCNIIQVTEYECAKCGWKWINRKNGKDGEKPSRCAKCKRWDWEEGLLPYDILRLRRYLCFIERESTKYLGLFGPASHNGASELCATFLCLYPRPTRKELETVINPMCYWIGPWGPHKTSCGHYGACSEEGIGCSASWIPDPERPGYGTLDWKIDKERKEYEKKVRRMLMQEIIDSRVVNTDSTYYDYFEGQKELIEEIKTWDEEHYAKRRQQLLEVLHAEDTSQETKEAIMKIL